MTLLSDILQTTLTKNTQKLSIHFTFYHIIFYSFINQQGKIHDIYIYTRFQNKVFQFLSVICSKPQELNKYMIILNNTDTLKVKTIIY